MHAHTYKLECSFVIYKKLKVYLSFQALLGYVQHLVKSYTVIAQVYVMVISI